MKTFTRFALLAAGLLAAAASVVLADDTKITAPAAKHPRLHAAVADRHAVRQRLAKKLDLSADQISQLKAAREKTASAVKAIRADQNLSAEEKKAKVRDALKSARNEMHSVLTPDQQKKLHEVRSRFRLRG
jgi:Spy/CpxP family protein refolding chaperone